MTDWKAWKMVQAFGALVCGVTRKHVPRPLRKVERLSLIYRNGIVDISNASQWRICDRCGEMTADAKRRKHGGKDE